MKAALGSRAAVAGTLIALTSCGADHPDGERPEIGTSSTAALTEVTGFGSNPGHLRMYEYVPPGLPPGAPLVVAMHGCTQSADLIATETGWNDLADRFGFAVVYPGQQSANNFSLCFNWFQPGDIARGQGEALSIAQMVDDMKSRHGSDPGRVFVTGMSAGGYMTEVMMAAYPDVFAGGAVNSGGAYRCASSLVETSACQQGSVDRTPRQWGDLVRGAFPAHPGPYPRLIAFHGSADFTVQVANLQQSVDQWSDVLGIDRTADVDETFRTAAHRIYRDANGAAMIETYAVAGMGHALTVDPGAATDQGGATGPFSEDHDIHSSYYAAVFWGLTGGGTGPDAGSPDGGNPGGPDAAGGVSASETFSAASGPDNLGWTFGGWELDPTRDATGTAGSRSLAGAALPRFGGVVRTARWTGLALGPSPTLSYSRQLSLVGANLAASTTFQVVVDDGARQVVDEQGTAGLGSHVETSWTPRTVELSAYAGRTVAIEFVVGATDPLSAVSSARAWVDDIHVD